jgi:precorrin-2 dehydrogenase/sirohydrochlorin ferrochelatase
VSQLYPAMLRIAGRRCVVIGGGRIATRKVAPLLEAGASVLLIAPNCGPQLEAVGKQGRVRWEPRAYRAGDLEGAALVFAATDSPAVNAAVAAEAKARDIPVNVADDPTASTFHVPAVVEREGLVLTVSTGGRSPAFARRLRLEIEALLSPERLALLELYAELRASLGEQDLRPDGSAWEAADERALDLLRAGRPDEARRVLERQVLAAPGGKA